MFSCNRTILLSLFCCFLYVTEGKTANDIFLVFQIYSQDIPGKAEGFVSVMEQSTKGTIKVLYQFPCIYGARGTRKEWEGDKRTPLGMYMVREIEKKSKNNANSYLKFGGYSIELNYPNWHDQKEGRSGGEITIHGGRMINTLGCPRVLDGTLSQPSFGTRNIKKIASRVKKWTKVIIVEDCPAKLLGKPNQLLPVRSATFWNGILGESLSREALAARLRVFEEGLPALSIEASSVYGESGKYSPWNLMDGLKHTAWVAKPSDPNKTITYRFESTQFLDKLWIKNGYQKQTKKQDRWKQNARPRKIKLTFDDGRSRVLYLEDRRGAQQFDMGGIKTRFVIVEILDYTQGSKFPNDVCISELWFEQQEVLKSKKIAVK